MDVHLVRSTLLIHSVCVVCIVVVIGIVVLTTILSATHYLVHDAGGYDAGVPSSYHSGCTVDAEGYHLLLLLIMHEVLVVVIVPTLLSTI